MDNCVYLDDSYISNFVVTNFMLARLVIVLLLYVNSFKHIGVLVAGHMEIKYILKIIMYDQ